MSSTKISPPSPITAACSTSCAASGDLFAKLRDDTAAAAQHIAEAHHFEPGAAFRMQGLAAHFGQTLGGAHHIGRIDRFVGRDQDEFLNTELDRRAADHQGAPGVVAHSFPSVGLLHQRHVLVGRSVK